MEPPEKSQVPKKKAMRSSLPKQEVEQSTPIKSGNVQSARSIRSNLRQKPKIDKKVLQYFESGAKQLSDSSEEEGEEKFDARVEDEEGQKFEAFNLKDVRENWRVDEKGSWKERKEEYDPWLAEVDEAAHDGKGPLGQKAFEEHKKKFRKVELLDEDNKEPFDFSSFKQKVGSLLENEKETPTTALQRLSRSIDKLKKKGESFEKESKEFDDLTEFCHQLMTHGLMDIYQMKKSDLVVLNDDDWEYLDAEEKLFGPFKASVMQSWREQGYFLDPSVKVRKVAQSVLDDDLPWQSSQEITKFF